METKEFTNGFDSWYETYFEVVDFIVTQRNQKIQNCTVKEVLENCGITGLWDLAKSWTDEFELLNKSREWDGEFYEEVDKFCLKKNKP